MAKFDFSPDLSWLEVLEPLDNVYLLPSYWGSIQLNERENEITVTKISRITKTLIVLTDGSKFRRKDGKEVGGLAKKKPAKIFPYSAENKKALAEYRLKQYLIARIESFNLHRLPADKLVEIADILDQVTNIGVIT